jgi:pimeloyl-ACP methyl ester carboxylesterase
LTVAFREGFVETDGFAIRYMEAGVGPPLVHLHGGRGMRLTPAHDLLSEQFRVIAFEMPGFGRSPANTRTSTGCELAATMATAVGILGIERFNLLATSFGSRIALWIAVQQPERVQALVLESPAAIRPAGHRAPAGTAQEIAQLIYAHPERLGPQPAVDPAIEAKQRTLLERLRGPDRDFDLEAKMRSLATPTLVLFGNLDRVISPDFGRCYKAVLPNCHLVFVYDAGHAISTDRPEAFVAVTRDFLERHEAFVISRANTVIYP